MMFGLWRSKRPLAVLGLIVLLSTGVRLGWVLHTSAQHPNIMVTPDSASYLLSAEALAETGQFHESVGSDEPMFVRTPGYPAFLAGLRLVGLSSVRAIAVVQALLSSVLTLLAYRLGGQLTKEKDHATALVAALLCGFSPLVLWSTASVLTEFLNAIALAAFATLMIDTVQRAGDRRGYWFAGAAGLALAAATLIRPTTYYLPLLIVPLSMVLLRSRLPWRRVALHIGVLMVPTVLLIGGWQVRNAQQVGSSRYAGIEALSMYTFRAAGVRADQTGRSFDVEQAELVAQFAPRGDEQQGPYLDRMYARGLSIVRSDPVAVAKTTTNGLIESTFGVSVVFASPDLPPKAPFVALARASVVGLWLCAAVGSVGGWRSARSRPATVILVVVVAYVLVISAGPESYSRFRAPVETLLCVLVAAGITQLAQWRPRRFRSLETTRN